jgi:hypothetical protein
MMENLRVGSSEHSQAQQVVLIFDMGSLRNLGLSLQIGDTAM